MKKKIPKIKSVEYDTMSWRDMSLNTSKDSNLCKRLLTLNYQYIIKKNIQYTHREYTVMFY